MHQSSYLKMEWFKKNYLQERKKEEIKILDIGSCDMGGSYRPIFSEEKWLYTGMDMVQGANVDVVVEDCYNWKEIESSAYDVVISGQAFEHMPYFWLVMEEIKRVLKQDGICCIIAPSGGEEHRCPVDCYRFYTDGMIALADYVQMNLLYAFTGEGYRDDGKDIFRDNQGVWHDSILIAQKGNRYRRHDSQNSMKVVVWGTGTLAAKLWNRLPNLDMEITAFVDNDRTQVGKKFRGCRIISPDELVNAKYECIVICSHKYYEILEQITGSLCVERDRILIYKDII